MSINLGAPTSTFWRKRDGENRMRKCQGTNLSDLRIGKIKRQRGKKDSEASYVQKIRYQLRSANTER